MVAWLGQDTYTFGHVLGTQNVLADFFSRTPTKNQTSDLISDPSLLSSNQVLLVTSNQEGHY